MNERLRDAATVLLTAFSVEVRSLPLDQVSQLLQSGKNADALKAALSGAPIGNKNQQEKDAALAVVLRVILSMKQQNQVSLSFSVCWDPVSTHFLSPRWKLR